MPASPPARKDVAGVKTFGALVDLHIDEMKEVGKPLGRAKAYSLELLKNRLGRCKLENLDRERVIQFGKDRAAEGAGPVTVSMDIGSIRTLLTDGAVTRYRRSRSIAYLIKSARFPAYKDLSG